eukprot:8696659-Alexandrium_andersonii.AAC.1
MCIRDRERTATRDVLRPAGGPTGALALRNEGREPRPELICRLARRLSSIKLLQDAESLEAFEA